MPAGIELKNGVRLTSEGHDRYTRTAGSVRIPQAAYREQNDISNSQATVAKLEDGDEIDLSKATPEMTKRAYDMSVKKFPNASASQKAEEERKEYAWKLLGEMVADSQSKYVEPQNNEVLMLPRSNKRMKQPPRAEKKKYIIKLTKKPKTVTKQAAKAPAPAPDVRLDRIFQIPDLAVKAKKPKVEVMFDFGSLGRQRARYHWAGESDKTLNLIFDTRFKMSDAYVPAEINDPQHITEVSISTPGSAKRYDYRCWGTVISLDFGIFKIVQLVLVKDELGPRMHEENTDGQARDDRGGDDTGGGTGGEGEADGAHEEVQGGILAGLGKPR